MGNQMNVGYKKRSTSRIKSGESACNNTRGAKNKLFNNLVE